MLRVGVKRLATTVQRVGAFVRGVARGLTGVLVLGSVACSGGESRVAPTGDRGLAFYTVSDAVTGGDYAVVFDVVSEREFEYSDISRPADGSPPTSPPSTPEDGYVGRVVHVSVESVVWSDGEHRAPAAFDFVTPGWELRGGLKRVPEDLSWYRVEVGSRYFGVFSDFGGAHPALTAWPYRWRAASPDVPTIAPIAAHEWPSCRARTTASPRFRSASARARTASRTARSAVASRTSAGSACSKRAASSSAWSRISWAVRGMGIT
jgi:hypothetical protein